jgi:hypothetical protein
MRRAQLSFGDGFIAEEVKDLHEVWMNHADRVLDDEVIVENTHRREPVAKLFGTPLITPHKTRQCI